MVSTAVKAIAKKEKKLKSKPKLSKSIDKSKTKSNNKNKFSDGSKSIISKRSSKKKKNKTKPSVVKEEEEEKEEIIQCPNASQQLNFFLKQYQSATGVQLSSLELDSLKETSIVELFPGQTEPITGNLGEHVKSAFGPSWKKVLCEKRLQEAKIDPGNPALLVISSSALRSLELFRELRPLTKECHAAKLFSKHMKVEEQVTMLKERVNVASGTPSRIKKLIEIEALGLSRLSLVVLDMHADVKGYSLFSLPQVRDEFWDLYKSFFHQPLLEGKLRLCLYGPLPTKIRDRKRKPDE